MRVLAAIAVCFLLALPALVGQDTIEKPAQGETETVVVLRATVEVPPNDLRRIRLPRAQKGASVLVTLRAETGDSTARDGSGANGPAAGGTGGPRDGSAANPFEVEILRREATWWGKVGFRQMQTALIATEGNLDFQIPDDSEYQVALRQVGDAKRPARIALQVELRGTGEALAPKVRTLSRERRIAVAVFSLGFLWTTLVICGVPLIRAFRSRRTPPSPPWYA